MMESKVFADNFSRSFSESGDFFQFLSARQARISGHALNKVSKSVFAEILNYCMGVASGDSLIKVADEKVSAVHGGNPKDYTVMEMLPLFKATSDFLNREYPRNTFMTAHFDHSIATACVIPLYTLFKRV